MKHLAGITDSTEAAQDAAQEAFVRLWEGRERWTAGSPRALLFTMGRNAAFDLRRRSDVRRRADSTGVPMDAPVTPERELERREIRDQLHAALDALPRRRRDVFELTWMRGLSHVEAAEVLGIAPQTVANLISLTLRDLRSLLSGLGPDSPAQPRGEPREEANDG